MKIADRGQLRSDTYETCAPVRSFLGEEVMGR